MNDPVNHPSHYTSSKIECIDAIEASMSREQFIGYLKGQVMKYNWRSDHKGKRVEDTKKAEWYQKKLSAVISDVCGICRKEDCNHTCHS